ncbi:MAG: envelope stress response membrane protein PspC [Rhodanobacteraceae bacterium]
MRYESNRRAERLYRDPGQGKLMGVCAGLADYLGCNVTFIRILAIIALFWFHALTLIAYLLLGCMLPTRPDPLDDGNSDEKFWRGARRSAAETCRDIRDRFRELDIRLQRMEGYVTSRRYDLDRQFRDLEN